MAQSYVEEIAISLSKKADAIISTLPVFAAQFFNSLKEKNSSPRTRLQYAYDMQHFFNWLSKQAGFKDTNMQSLNASDILDKLTVADLQEYASTLESYTASDGSEHLYSQESKARRLSSLRSFYRYYFKIGAIEHNLADLIDIPKIKDKEIITMDVSQAKRLLEAVNDCSGMTEAQQKRHRSLIQRDYAIMMTFLGTGIRVSELVGIDLSDVDFYNASILITRKGGDQDLTYFGQQVEDALLDYISDCRPSLLKDSSNANMPDFPLFLSNRGQRLTVRSVELLVKKYAQKARISAKITPHALRRTYGTNLYNETGDIYLVADALHHSSVETTRKHYAKIDMEHKRKAANVADDLLKEK